MINERFPAKLAQAKGTRVLPQDPVPMRVSVPGNVGFDINQVKRLAAEVAGKVGHPMCFSGFDISFLQERELVFEADGSLYARGGF